MKMKLLISPHINIYLMREQGSTGYPTNIR